MGGEPSPAEIQAEFYFQQLQAIDGDIWIKACTIHATSDHWPTVDVLKITCRELAPSISHRTAPPVWGPEFITRDEFGQNLFEVIKTLSGMLAIRKQMAAAVHHEKNHKLKGLQERWDELHLFISNQLPTLTDKEMAQVLERYPDVVTL